MAEENSAPRGRGKRSAHTTEETAMAVSIVPIEVAGTWIYLKAENRLVNVGVGNIAVIEFYGSKTPDRNIILCSVANGSQVRHKLPLELWPRFLAGLKIINPEDMPKED